MQIFEYISILLINFCPSGSTCLSATLLPHPQTSCSFLPRVSQSIFAPQTHDRLFPFHFFQFSLLTWVSQRISAPKTHASSFICSFCSGSRFHSCFPRVSQSISVPKTHAGFLIQIKSFAGFLCPIGNLLTSVFYFLTTKNGHHSSSSSSGAHFIYNSF